MGSWTRRFDDGKPYLAMVTMQLSYGVMSIIAKCALNHGMSPHVLVAYRLAVASVLITPFAFVLERKLRPKMSLSVFLKIMLISLLEPVLDHTFYYTGMKYTTATFTAAMCNVLPAITFALAWILRLERVEIGKVRSQMKVAGTVVTVGGAMLMTLIKGPILDLPWTKGQSHHSGRSGSSKVHKQDLVIGALMLIAGCCCWACFIISQASILKSYPAKLSLTSLICITGTVEAAVLALAMERRDTSVWRIELDTKLVAAVYGGLVTAFAIYTMGSVMKKRGPVFVSSFNPLQMVIVAVLGSIFLAEEMYLGRVIGSIVIVIGLYLVLWGKSKDRPQPTPEITADRQMDTINGCIENPDPEPITTGK